MKPKNCLIFGASGLIGRHLIRKLTQNNFKVTAVTRNIHQKGYILKTQGNPGYINIVESNIFDENKIRVLLKKADICINLVGILYEKGKVNTFKNIHENFQIFCQIFVENIVFNNLFICRRLELKMPKIVCMQKANYKEKF